MSDTGVTMINATCRVCEIVAEGVYNHPFIDLMNHHSATHGSTSTWDVITWRQMTLPFEAPDESLDGIRRFG